MQVGQRIRLYSEKQVQQGFCLGHETAGGQPVFIHGSLPDEFVEIRITRVRKQHLFGVVTKVLQANPERLESDCPVFPECGGCSYRHMDYTQEVQTKLDLLGEWQYLVPALQKPDFKIHTAAESGYRNSTQLHVYNHQIGFYRLHSNEIVPLPDEGCALLSPRLNAFLRNDEWPDGKLLVRELQSGPILARRNAVIQEPISLPGTRSLDWQYEAAGFWQVNRFLTPLWLQTMFDWMRQAIGDATPSECLELFCGSGLIGGSLNPFWQEYLGYEDSRLALKAANQNFKRLTRGQNSRWQFRHSNLYERKLNFCDQTGSNQLRWAIANPPRSGLADWMPAALRQGDFRWLLYSSCNPATLNRDLKTLHQNDYSIERGCAFDFFARTAHIEVLLLLRLQDRPQQ
ncbi:MAG: class I SAM-dependent RNA methyltransferase [Leptospiraceae bacterium]|nr:class I SAM-dependent RNA methyltransferase [Leptospiraceae bacterium]